MTEDQRQDVIAWLEDQPDPMALHALALIDYAEARENTVLGMCMARRPHAEIRDYLLTGVIPAVTE